MGLNFVVWIRQSKRCQNKFAREVANFRAAKLKGFTVTPVHLEKGHKDGVRAGVCIKGTTGNIQRGRFSRNFQETNCPVGKMTIY